MTKGKKETSVKLTQQEAVAKISDLLKQAEKHLEEATQIAEEYAIEFSWGGPDYGMGGTYNPHSAWHPSSDCEWEQSDQETRGWQSSSAGC